MATMTKEESAQGFAELWKALKLSKYRVKRAFNNLSSKEKGIILSIANIEQRDVLNNLQQTKLEHFTESGRLKIAGAIKTIRTISNNMPDCLRLKEFIQIDEE